MKRKTNGCKKGEITKNCRPGEEEKRKSKIFVMDKTENYWMFESSKRLRAELVYGRLKRQPVVYTQMVFIFID